SLRGSRCRCSASPPRPPRGYGSSSAPRATRGTRRASIRGMWRLHLALIALALAGCHRELSVALRQQIEAQRLAAAPPVPRHRSAEAVQRAIMADTDDSSAAFALEAQQASEAFAADLSSVEPILADDGAAGEVRLVKEAFAGISALDRTLLP